MSREDYGSQTESDAAAHELKQPNEEWRPIPGWEGYYEVSDLGRVASLERTVATFGGRQIHRLPARLMRLQNSQPSGYLSVQLAKGGEYRRIAVHTLVLTAFVGPRPEGMHGCHYDGDRMNNSLSNLRWDTPLANAADMRRHGTHVNTKKTHCRNGHAYSADNTQIGSNGHRRCRKCRRAAYLRSREAIAS